MLNAIVATAAFFLEKKSRVRTIVALLYRYKVPVTDDTMFLDAAGVLNTIAASDQVSEEMKKFAYMTLGELNGIRISNRPLSLILTGIVMDAEPGTAIAAR